MYGLFFVLPYTICYGMTMHHKVARIALSGKGVIVETANKDTTEGRDRDKQELTLIVHAPRKPDPKPFTWPKTMKVGDAAKNAATDFGYSGGSPGFLLLGSAPRSLDNKKTLVAEHLKDHDEVEITDTGGGV